jgi:hypothetical protein
MSVSVIRARTGSVTKRVRKDGTTVYGVCYWVRGEAQPRWELQPPGTSLRAARSACRPSAAPRSAARSR